MDTRDPLAQLSLNVASSSRGPSTSTPTGPKKLAPIFTRIRKTPVAASSPQIAPPLPSSSPDNSSFFLCTPPSSSLYTSSQVSSQIYVDSPGSPRKRVKVDSSFEILGDERDINAPVREYDGTFMGMDVDMDEGDSNTGLRMGSGRTHVRVPSIPDWFMPSTTSNGEVIKRTLSSPTEEIIDIDAPGTWRRPRRRFGVGAQRPRMTDYGLSHATFQATPYLQTLVHNILPYNPFIPPPLILIPSIASPSGRPRDFSPALSVAFNNTAKIYDADSPKNMGIKRLVAVAGEEGGLRVIDVDEGLGGHREEKGWWWRAHPNAIFDVRWSADDSRLLTASGDQSSKVHALDAPTPICIATLAGHTSSTKTAIFFDPSRSNQDAASSGSIVASGGRDGNISIFDMRTKGRLGRNDWEDAREYSQGDLGPVMVIRGAHSEGGKKGYSRTATRSVTSLCALQAMPGILASGGSFDGIVKLWDLRFPTPTTRSPDPRPTCTPWASLPDPTISSTNPGRRPRGINNIVENPITGDLLTLCGDSKIHTIRPSPSTSPSDDVFSSSIPRSSTEDIFGPTYSHPELLVSSFYIRVAISPDGKHLACGSGKGGVIAWDLERHPSYSSGKGMTNAVKFGLGMGGTPWPENKLREVTAVDWGKDMLAACADDYATRIWRSDFDVARKLKEDPQVVGNEWMGAE